MADRYVTAPSIAQEYGFSSRHWTRQAAMGRVPGACQPSGEGGRWMFDRTIFARWWKAQHKEVQEWQASTNGAASTGRAHNVKVRSDVSALRHEIDALLKNVSAPG